MQNTFLELTPFQTNCSKLKSFPLWIQQAGIGHISIHRTLRRILNKYKIDFPYKYFDDDIVFSLGEGEHFQHLEILFDICVKENLEQKLSKCNFVKTIINFLGYKVFNIMIISHLTIKILKLIKKKSTPNQYKRVTAFWKIHKCDKFL